MIIEILDKRAFQKFQSGHVYINYIYLQLVKNNAYKRQAIQMKNTFIVTKLKTTNVGNQALTEELINMFVEECPERSFIFQGRPLGLDGYTTDRLIRVKDPIKVFEGWAKNIANKAEQEINKNFIGYETSVPRVELVNFSEKSVTSTVEKVKAKYLRPLKRYLSRYIIYSHAYENRLKKILSSKEFVYSGAGEVGDNNVFLRQLLELRVAQLLGLRTAIINQSVVLKTELFHKLVGYVYGRLDHLVVRGNTSKANLVKYGVVEDKIRLAPDTAFKTKKPDQVTVESLAKKFAVTNNTVGFNLTNWFTTDLTKFENIINLIRSKGYEIVFITNEPFEDSNFGKYFNERYGIPFIEEKIPYKDYSALLSNLVFLISARLHSNVLALTAGTVVIPIEGNVFKTTELLELANYPIKVINPSLENWEVALKNEVQNLMNGEYDFNDYFENVLPGVQKQVFNNATWLNEK